MCSTNRLICPNNVICRKFGGNCSIKPLIIIVVSSIFYRYWIYRCKDSSFQPITSVPHIPHITGSRYFGVDHEHVEENVDERKCRDLPLGGQSAFDAARTVKVFHVCRESHEVPEQVQHSEIDDIMSLKWKGQNAYDAAQEHEHLCGDG